MINKKKKSILYWTLQLPLLFIVNFSNNLVSFKFIYHFFVKLMLVLCFIFRKQVISDLRLLKIIFSYHSCPFLYRLPQILMFRSAIGLGFGRRIKMGTVTAIMCFVSINLVYVESVAQQVDFSLFFSPTVTSQIFPLLLPNHGDLNSVSLNSRLLRLDIYPFGWRVLFLKQSFVLMLW